MEVQFRQRARRPRYVDLLGPAIRELIRLAGAISRDDVRNSSTSRLSDRRELIKVLRCVRVRVRGGKKKAARRPPSPQFGAISEDLSTHLHASWHHSSSGFAGCCLDCSGCLLDWCPECLS